MNSKLSQYSLIILVVFLGFIACQEAKQEGTVEQVVVEKEDSWQSKIVFDNYLLPEVDSLNQLIRSERLGFELFDNFKNNDSLSFYKQFINLTEQAIVYEHSSTTEYIEHYNTKIETKRNDCFRKLRMKAYDTNQLNWNTAQVDQVIYDLFDAENDHVFLKVIVKVNDGNGNVFELKAPDCVYVGRRLKIVKPIQWEGISCWMML